MPINKSADFLSLSFQTVGILHISAIISLRFVHDYSGNLEHTYDSKTERFLFSVAINAET